jgi:DNA polymerase sigma
MTTHLARLLLGFFKFWGFEFAYEHVGVVYKPRDGYVFMSKARSGRVFLRPLTTNEFGFENPDVPGQNLGAAVKRFEKIRESFMAAFTVLSVDHGSRGSLLVRSSVLGENNGWVKDLTGRRRARESLITQMEALVKGVEDVPSSKLINRRIIFREASSESEEDNHVSIHDEFTSGFVDLNIEVSECSEPAEKRQRAVCLKNQFDELAVVELSPEQPVLVPNDSVIDLWSE